MLRIEVCASDITNTCIKSAVAISLLELKHGADCFRSCSGNTVGESMCVCVMRKRISQLLFQSFVAQDRPQGWGVQRLDLVPKASRNK